MALIVMPRIRLGGLMTKNRFIVNKANNLGPMDINIGGKTYSCVGDGTNNPLFEIKIGNTTFSMNFKYQGEIVKSLLTAPYGAFYKYFYGMPLKVYRESSGIGLSWPAETASVSNHSGSDTRGSSDWPLIFASPVSSADTPKNIWKTLLSEFDAGSDIIVELG